MESDECLAAGFAAVDERKDAAAYRACLSLIDSLPYYRRCKRQSYDLLDLKPGLTVLEVGCGLGDDVLRMAERVTPGGKVIGIDASARMLEAARDRALKDGTINFLIGDARRLPFQTAGFDRSRIDRTLQHIKDPGRVVREMARILKPGGLLLAYDNDWGTFVVSGSDDEITRIIETLWTDSFTNRWVGRYLKEYFTAAGLDEIAVHPSVSVLTDFETADGIYYLRQTVGRAVDIGLLTPTQASRWISDLQDKSREGMFLCTLTAFTVVGRKPGL